MPRRPPSRLGRTTFLDSVGSVPAPVGQTPNTTRMVRPGAAPRLTHSGSPFWRILSTAGRALSARASGLEVAILSAIRWLHVVGLESPALRRGASARKEVT
jgi:hypothetical protein